MSKATPGPWSYEDNPYGHDAIYGADGRLIAHVFGDDAQAQADARLIAAAPELLEAAQMVIAWYEAEDDHSKADFYERMQMCRDSESALRAAIAKATGEQA